MCSVALGRCVKQVGFSGTNDTSKLLPLSMKTLPHDARTPTLQATNGKMMFHLLTNAEYQGLTYSGEPGVLAHVPAVRSGQRVEVKVSSLVLSVLAKCQQGHSDGGTSATIRALVDVGALMAGLSNRRVAELLLAHHPVVVFFETAASAAGWKVVNDKGQEWRLEASPIPARSAFVFFDEARCRGADLVLHPEAVAVVTLCAGLRKDALIQVCACVAVPGSRGHTPTTGTLDCA